MAYFRAASELALRPLSRPARAYDGTLAISTAMNTIKRWLADAIRHMPSVAPSTIA
jgi:hypothetical protein